ncbi:hypothetical protein QAD02_006684 [Eretmocerus hayati]|uniref:Uncharacterized protein n=1 Tax=Eretmocerus hayati TaxID=131215 RepID=A0ACC2N3X2_9HYME|nr:hypothetical protein QAD02_006684 [Eretmocerus hayati]
MMTVMCPNCMQLFGAKASNGPPPPPGPPGFLVDDHEISADDKGRQRQVTISTKSGVGSGGCLLLERVDNDSDENEINNREELDSSSALMASLSHSTNTITERNEPANGLELLLELRCQRPDRGAGAGGCCLVLKQPQDDLTPSPISPGAINSPRLNFSSLSTSSSLNTDTANGARRAMLETTIDNSCIHEKTEITEDNSLETTKQAQPQRSSHSTTARLDTAASLDTVSPSSCLQRVMGSGQQTSQCGCCRCRCRCCCSPCCCLTYCRSSRGSGCSSGSSNISNYQHRHHHHSDEQLPRAKPEGLKRSSSSTAGGDCGGELFEIQLNAGLRLLAPLSLSKAGGGGGCTFSLASTSDESPANSNTISTTTISTSVTPTSCISSSSSKNNIKPLNIFHGGGGLVVEKQPQQQEEIEQETDLLEEYQQQQLQQLDATAAGLLYERDLAKLAEARRRLQHSGWYHEGLSWQQSEALLKNASLGTWLMRDSSDRRYTFAISVQTNRGPTSVRVLYLMGKFRLDAEPHLASSMPLFDCPIRMIEYYREYSHRQSSGQLRGQQLQEVWVDYNNQVYSQIYLADPLLKEVVSLSHLARIAINRNSADLGEQSKALPPLIRDYLDEYPYAF